MATSIFETKDFNDRFRHALEEYNFAIDNSTEPPKAAQEFMRAMFDSDFDEAFEFQSILENMDDQETARKLQDIVFNSASLIS